ncbi:MAG: hypothetical protein J0I06_03470 [Planctomycetes bacterium]|nr:hypothetical protein [Planctomycetota bacterium]
MIAKFLAERLKVSTLSFESSASEFLQQLQLFADLSSYRDALLVHIDEKLTEIAAKDPTGKLVLVAHSLGTVVTFIALLRAQARSDPPTWLGQVERFVTFGSPLDLVLVLFPEYFPPLPGPCARGIAWTNYTLWNDPIATDLRITSERFLPARAPGLF